MLIACMGTSSRSSSRAAEPPVVRNGLRAFNGSASGFTSLERAALIEALGAENARSAKAARTQAVAPAADAARVEPPPVVPPAVAAAPWSLEQDERNERPSLSVAPIDPEADARAAYERAQAIKEGMRERWGNRPTARLSMYWETKD
jgi:hypothetical protein